MAAITHEPPTYPPVTPEQAACNRAVLLAAINGIPDDDIDDYVTSLGEPAVPIVDDAAIERALTGEQVPLTPRDRSAIVDRYAAMPAPDYVLLAQVLGIKLKSARVAVQRRRPRLARTQGPEPTGAAEPVGVHLPVRPTGRYAPVRRPECEPVHA